LKELVLGGSHYRQYRFRYRYNNNCSRYGRVGPSVFKTSLTFGAHGDCS
jgi:hypothetical protein